MKLYDHKSGKIKFIKLYICTSKHFFSYAEIMLFWGYRFKIDNDFKYRNFYRVSES